jgi:hypothetical protein
MTGGHAHGACPFTCEHCSAERQRCKQDKKKKNRHAQLRFDEDDDAYLVSKGENA